MRFSVSVLERLRRGTCSRRAYSDFMAFLKGFYKQHAIYHDVEARIEFGADD